MVRFPRRLAVAAATALLLIPAAGQARAADDKPDATLDAATRTEVIEATLKKLNEAYVLPDVARKMDEAIRERLKNKEYDEIRSGKDLAEALTKHLRDVCHDKHLRVIYSDRTLPSESPGDEGRPSAEMREKMRQYGAVINYGFNKVERLPGNVGYLSLDGFFPAEFGAETACAAMNFLANTDALIIDLRNNHGGSPDMVALLCSYLFDAEPVHLNDLYFRPDDSTHQWWTLPYVPGKRFVDKPVYVLTSKETFSAAEEFTYNLKTRKRATIVGETTGGGANPGGTRRINDHFAVWVPSGRAINPVTRTNWEGTGVKPDLDVPADQALLTAQVDALEKIKATMVDRKGPSDKDLDPMIEDRLRRTGQEVERLKKELDKLKENRKDSGSSSGK
jgi:hypothetical protein